MFSINFLTLIFASLKDYERNEIPNILPLFLFVVNIVYVLFLGFDNSIWYILFNYIIITLLISKFGGGDIKMFYATSILLNPMQFLSIIILTCMFSLIYSKYDIGYIEKNYENVKVGDVLYENLKLHDKTISRNIEGLNKEEVKLIKEEKILKLNIAKIIPMMPFYTLAYIIIVAIL